MKTLIIVIIILLCVLSTPLSLKRLIDQKKGRSSKGWPASPPATDTGAAGGLSHTAGSDAAITTSTAPAAGTDLQDYLSRSVERIVKDALRATREDPAETKFLLSFAAAASRAAGRRRQLESSGEHIPPFLIASITDACNLNCAGCYAHALKDFSQAPQDAGKTRVPMTTGEWDRIFEEAEELGISFVFLVGGEPLLNREVIETAGRHKDLLFPIITNGLLINDAYLELFDRCRNLLPVISIEGEQITTDERRGSGVYQKIEEQMGRLSNLNIPFGASVTITTENLREATGQGFAEKLADRGCRMLLYIEYVATSAQDAALEPGEAERALMDLRLDALRQSREDMVILAFPGDEKAFGGCLAAGRGFFHISACGNAEPCPFAPFSDRNLKENTLCEALQSDLFAALDARDMLQEDHSGGCALSHKGAEIQALMKAR